MRFLRPSRFVFALAIALCLAGAGVELQAAGSATCTRTAVLSSNGVVRYDIAWTSSAGGAVSSNKCTISSGKLLAVKIVPGSGGTQPTDLYDVTITDDDGIDLLNGQGVDQSNATGKELAFLPPLFVDSSKQLDVVVANAGNAKKGTVTLWVQP